MEDEEHHDVAVGEELPHVLLEILLRLPVKSLSRFRCVCRAWNTAITSRQFISLQQQSQSQRDGVDTSLLLHYFLSNPRRNLFTVYRNDESSLFTEIERIDIPISSYDTYAYIASCNGLVCLSDYLSSSLGLWNPSIRKYVKIPIARPINTDINHTYILGFGFDCRTNDYKIVRARVIHTSGRDSVRQFPTEIEIFELGRFVWRRKTSVVPYFMEERSQAFVNGGVHWIGYSRPPPDGHHINLSLRLVVVVFVFDVHDEHFTDLEIPSGISNVHRPNLTVTVCMESLCLLEMNPWIEMEGRQMEGVCCVWVMKQYGVTSSWNRQFNIDMRDLGGLWKVLWFGKHGEVLVVNNSFELVSYDPETRGIKSVGLQGMLSSFHVMNHVESLVLLDR